jgi:hypothetical protein
MTPSEITSLILGLGALVVAGLTQVLAYKARVSHFRQTIYGKQVDGFTEVVQAIHQWYHLATSYLTINGFTLPNNESRLQFRNVTRELAVAADAAHSKWTLILPNEFNEAIKKYWLVYNAVSVNFQVAHIYPDNLVLSTDPGMDISNAYTEIVKVARKFLGTDELAAGVMKVVGIKQEKA